MTPVPTRTKRRGEVDGIERARPNESTYYGHDRITVVAVVRKTNSLLQPRPAVRFARVT